MSSMDSITHGLLGALTAQLGFRQRIGREATWLAAGAAMVADLDFMVRPMLSLAGVESNEMTTMFSHRGLSHSLFLSPLIALVTAVAWWWFRRRKDGKIRLNELESSQPGQTGDSVTPFRAVRFRLLYACLLTAVFSHPLLDWCTSYGTQLLLPFSHARYAIDAVPIIDFVYTSLLILALILCYLARKIAPDCSKRWTLIVGWTGLILSSGYILTGRAMHDLAISRASQELGAARISRADAYPAMGSILVWRVVVRSDTGWSVAAVHVLSPKKPAITSFAQADDEWVSRAAGTQEARLFDWFAMGRVRASHEQLDGLHVVEFHDMRYGRRTDSMESLWGLRVEFDSSGKLLAAHRFHSYRGISLGQIVGQAWHDIWNP